MGRKRTCELPFCHGLVEGTRNKRRCDKDRNIHLHQVISKNVRKIMRYVEGFQDFTANDVNRDLFKGKLDKNEKGSMYRLFQAMVREGYLLEKGKREGLKVYGCSRVSVLSNPENIPVEPERTGEVSSAQHQEMNTAHLNVEPPKVVSPKEILTGKLREFVHMKRGAWNHEDWIWLINRPDIQEFHFPQEEIGALLEVEKANFWANREA